ncbi:glycosyltransferase family 2 protein [Gemmatimonadota bacterium]
MPSSRNAMLDLSIVVPVFGCAECLPMLRQRIAQTLDDNKVDWELILVNDGSQDGAWDIILSITGQDNRVRGIDLSRNFGQHAAITAGLAHVSGHRIVVMDCDLQDRPEEIPVLLSKSKEGYEVVLARRVARQDSYLKRLFSRFFYRILNWLTGQEYDPAVANFGCYNRKVIEAVLAMGDKARSFPLFVNWVGFHTVSVDVTHASRELGRSTYTFRKSLALALNSMLTFSDRPLRMTVQFGLILSIIAGLVAIWYLIGAVQGAFAVQGWATLVISVWLLGALNILIIGIIGLYISKIFEQSKQRPLFIVRESTDIRRDKDT